MQVEIGVALGVAAMLCYGISDFILKRPSEREGAFQAGAYLRVLMFVATSVLVVVFASPSFGLTDLALAGLAGALVLGGTLSLFKGFNVSSVSLTTPLASCYSMIIVVFATLVLGEVLGLVELLGIIAVFVGIAFISVKSYSRKKFNVFSGAQWGLFTLLMWGFGYSISSLVVRRVGPISTLFLMECAMLTLIMVIHIFTGNKMHRISWKMGGLIALATSFNLTADLSLITSVTYGAFALTAPISSAYPAIAISLAAVFYRERLTHLQIAGVSLIILALAVLSV